MTPWGQLGRLAEPGGSCPSPTWLESLSPLPPHPIQATRILSLAPLAWALTMWGKAMVPAASAPARSRSRRELPDFDAPFAAVLGDSEDIFPPAGRVVGGAE